MNLSSEQAWSAGKKSAQVQFSIRNPTIKFEYDFEFVEDYVFGLIDELIEIFWINCYG